MLCLTEEETVLPCRSSATRLHRTDILDQRAFFCMLYSSPTSLENPI